MEGWVFDIRRYAINDGPGIRVTVFLKGCPLRCAWCHNPEGVAPGPVKLYTASRCIGCGTCVQVCETNAITLGSHGIVTDETLCTLCGSCAGVCPTRAIEMAGRRVTVGEVMEEIGRERRFMDESGGGVTFSGGEPLLQPGFLAAMLEECGRLGIHRTVDTTGFAPPETLTGIARLTDLFLYDLKIMDPAAHEHWTGVRNDRILENLRALAGAGSNLLIRIPLIAGINDDEGNILRTASFLRELPGSPPPVQLLPYHSIARSKYERMGKPESFTEFEEPAPGVVARCSALFRNAGIEVREGY